MTKTAAEKKTLTALRDSYPKYVISKNKIELTPEINVDELNLVNDSVNELNSNEFDEFRYIDNQKNSHKNRVYNTRGEANPMARRIMTPLGQFETLNSAAAALSISLDVLNKRSKSEKFKDYYYLDSRVKRVPRKNPSNAGKNSGVARRIMTPIGTFDTVREAHKALGIDVTTLYRRLGNAVKNPDYYYL